MKYTLRPTRYIAILSDIGMDDRRTNKRRSHAGISDSDLTFSSLDKPRSVLGRELQISGRATTTYPSLSLSLSHTCSHSLSLPFRLYDRLTFHTRYSKYCGYLDNNDPKLRRASSSPHRPPIISLNDLPFALRTVDAYVTRATIRCTWDRQQNREREREQERERKGERVRQTGVYYMY